MGARYLSGEFALKRFLNFVSEQYRRPGAIE